MAPEVLPSVYPFVISAASSFVVLIAIGMSSHRRRQVFLPTVPLLAVVALFVFGFFSTASAVRTCSDCASTLSIVGIDIIGTRRVGTGVGGELYSDFGWLLAASIMIGILYAVWRRPPSAVGIGANKPGVSAGEIG